ESSVALERELQVLDRVLDRVKEWEELLAGLQREYQESEEDRRIYGQARRQREKLTKAQEGIQHFLSSPTDENYPFSAAELVLEFLVIDPCAHGCTVEVSADGQSFRSIYQTHRLSHSGYGPASLSLEVREMPRFVRIAISGYARLGLVNVRGETIQGRYVPCSIETAEGCIVGAEHLLEWDQKCTFFNDPDVEEKWRIRGELPEHFVTLKFDTGEDRKD
ncbi:MAG: hypothetical protein KGZ25_12605, partial [Planctomycetes bacterium]|nr:hypothetical protein [Planctomycetota bacterium]